MARPGLEQEVAALGDLSRDELAARWLKDHGCAPPKGIKRPLLERSAAWHVQAKRLGSLPPEVRKTLRRLVRDRQGPDCPTMDPRPTAQARDPDRSRSGPSRRRDAIVAPIRNPRPGDRFVREWNGRTYVVDVVGDGFVLDGRTYRSLSAIARRITGARWSGPRFFGL